MSGVRSDEVETFPSLDLLAQRPFEPPATEIARFDTIPPGTVIDPYHVQRVLGAGAMGMVLLAWDESLERQVALKLIHPSLVDRPTARDRFRAEARAMARVRHPNVIEIFAFGDHQGAPYFAMEYLPGKTLADWIEAHEGPIPIDEAVRVLEAICAGVEAIHASGTAHRDLKPSNVLLSGDRVVVADFGVARLIADASGGGSIPSGTPAYLAPEMVLGFDDIPDRADVYSLGVMAYELLTGRRPFAGGCAQTVARRHLEEKVPPPSLWRQSLPEHLEHAVLDALQKDPSDRIPSVEAFRRRLRHPSDATLRIAVADDDPDFRTILGALVEKSFPGAELQLFENGEALVAAVASQRPSLVILDLSMPGMDGIETTTALRSQAGLGEVPIVITTGEGGAKDWRIAQERGASAFVVKPFDPLSFVATLRAVLVRVGQSVPPPSD